LQIFRQLSQKSAGAIRHLELCGIALYFFVSQSLCL